VSHDPPEIFIRIYARHGHRCPMSTLGGRLGLAALKGLGDCDGELQAVYSHRTCATDGIAETTGCTEEKGSLIVKNDGRHALALSCLENGWEELDAGEQVKRRVEMDAMLDELLPQFWQAEDQKLLQKNSKD
jgi:formylmethanofuran dehydrogenase subunit E